MTIRGGGNPTRNMAVQPRFRMGPPPRSSAADAHKRIMGPDLSDPPNTRLQGRRPRQLASSPQVVAAPALTRLRNMTGQAQAAGLLLTY